MKQTIKDIDVKNKKVLVRVDYNVPIKDGVITDDTRIKESVPTLAYLLQSGASLIIMSHLGRPEGKVDMQYSLKPCAERLSELLGAKVIMANDVVGKDATRKAKELKNGEVLLLENLRFYPEEETNDPEFCKKLATLGDVYVNDAFGTAHRKHASTYGVAGLLPNAIGFLMEKEVSTIGNALNSGKHPFVAIMGGAKVSDKIKLIDSLLSRVDTLLIGGAMAYTFLSASGVDVGNSLVEKDMLEEAKRLMSVAKEKGVNLELPIDHIVTDNINEPNEVLLTGDNNIPDNFIGVDIGKKTIKKYSKIIKHAKVILWNGPMGVFENELYSVGTYAIVKAVAKSKGFSIVGGGDSASAVAKSGYHNKINHISTGGGASLKMFEGKILPCVEVIGEK